MSDPSSTPSLSDDLNAINATKSGNLTDIPAGYSLLYSSTQNVTFAPNGLSACAYVNSAGQILIAFYGPNFALPTAIGAAARNIDLKIEANDSRVTDSMVALADQFYKAVEGAAREKNIAFSSGNVFVTGNSEGGLFAELTAKAHTLDGATFGAPGIPGETTIGGLNSDFTNYISTSDPIGNLGSDAYLSAYVQPGTGTQYHYGHNVFLGSSEDGQTIADLVGHVVKPTYTVGGETIGGLSDISQLLLDVLKYHAYVSYAASLGVALKASFPTPSDSNGKFFTNAGLLLSGFSLLKGTVAGATGSGGANFREASASEFTRTQGLITSFEDDGQFNNVLFQAPISAKDTGAGTLVIAQTDLKARIALQAKTWNNVQFENGKFNVTLKGTLAQSATDETLSLDATNGNIKIVADDNSNLVLTDVKDLQVENTGVGFPNFDVLDPESSKIKGQVAITGSSNTHNLAIASSVAGATLTLGSGTDTLLHLGADSVIDVGGASSPSGSQQATQYKLSVTNDTLVIGGSGDSIALNGNGLVQTGGALSSTPGNTSLYVANGSLQTLAGGTGNNILVAAGTNNILEATQSGQTLIALGQSNDVLNGQTSNTSGLDRLIAIAGSVVGGNASNAGNDTLNAGVGNNIMIGEGVNTTFNIDANANPGAIDVIWGKGGNDTFAINGNANIYIVNDPNASLRSVENLDPVALSNYVIAQAAKPTWNGDMWGPSVLPIDGEPIVIIINPSQQSALRLSGTVVGGASYNVTNITSGSTTLYIPEPGETDEHSVETFASQITTFGMTSSDGLSYQLEYQAAIHQNVVDISQGTQIVGFANGNLGIQFSGNGPAFTSSDTTTMIPDEEDGDWTDLLGTPPGTESRNFSEGPLVDPNFYAQAGGPQVDLTQFQSAANSANFPAAAAVHASAFSAGMGVTDQSAVTDDGVTDTLIQIHSAVAFGNNDVLIARTGTNTLTSYGNGDTLVSGSGQDTLIAYGGGDALFGNAAGSTLDATHGVNAVASYSQDGVIIDLGTGTAGINGSTVVDTLEGFSAAAGYGAHDTLVGGAGVTTLISNGQGSTLIAGTGSTVAEYDRDNAIVDLAAGTATIGGAGVSDTLIGITAVQSAGLHDTLVSAGTGNSLTVSGEADTILSSGTGSVLTADGKMDVLRSSGAGNTLIDQVGQNTLISSGVGDTLFGSATGTVIDATAGSGAVAVYTGSQIAVDLAAGTARKSGETSFDVLLGVHAVTASGSGDTIVGGSGVDVLVAGGDGNTLIANGGADSLSADGAGNVLVGNAAGSTLDGSVGTGTVAAYALDNLTIDLGNGTAALNGSAVSDTLIGISTLTAFGHNDTLIGGSSQSTLIGGVNGNTLVAGTGQTIALYSLDGVAIDLSTGAATISGGNSSDTLVGLSLVTVSGKSDTVTAGSGSDTLVATGLAETLIGGAGASTLSASGIFTTLLGGSGANLLTSNGFSNVLIAESSANTLRSIGDHDTLIAGNGADTLLAGGTGDILFGNAAGSTLAANTEQILAITDELGNSTNIDVSSHGTGIVAAYRADNVTVDLGSGTATVNGSGVDDTLIGIYTAEALGTNDTLVGAANLTTLISNAAGNTLIASTGTTVASYNLDDLTIDLSQGTAALNGSTSFDTLVGIATVSVAGHDDTLIAGAGTVSLSSSGADNLLFAGSNSVSLSSSGTDDTLFGNAAGSTLIGQYQNGAIAAYNIGHVTVDLDNGTAGINGSSIKDTLIGMGGAAAFGSNDTLIAQFVPATLFSNAANNTLIAGASSVVAAYTADHLTVDLVGGSAGVNGSSNRDTLLGVRTADVTGIDDTVVSDGSGNTLIAGNSSASAIFNVDDIVVDLGAGTALVVGSSIGDTLTGITQAVVNGANDVALAGSGVGTLVAGGINDTLVAHAGGYTLEAGTSSEGASVLYAADDIVVDLAAGTATCGFGTTDTLIGIRAVAVAGSYDTVSGGSGTNTLQSSGFNNTLIAGNGADTLSSSGHQDTLIAGSGSQTLISLGVGNTLIAGSSADLLTTSGVGDFLLGNGLGSTLNGVGGSGAVAVYTMDHVKVDLAAGTAGVNGAGTADTLTGIASAAVAGAGDTIIAGSGVSALSSSGLNNTLIGGGGTDTLSSSGSSDALIGGSGTDLISSSGSQNTLIAGSGTDILTSSGTNDMLLGGAGSDTIASSGTGNTLVAGGGVDTLSSTGVDDTLFGNGAGSTLNGTNGVGTIAAYSMDNVTVDLVTGAATVNGSGVSDTLLGITSVLVTGSNDTLIGGTGATTLYSDGAGNTLIAGTGQTTVVYTQDDVTVDLATASATVNGSSGSDTLVGINNAAVSGSGDTIIGGGAGSDILSSNGLFNTLIAGSGANTLSSSGLGDTLLAGSGADTLSSSGQNNVLIAGSAVDFLTSAGFGDTLVGNAAGSTLDGTNGVGTIASYAINDVTVDLAIGTATVNGSGVSDTLLGITTAQAAGTNDTLIGGSGATTLLSNAAGNTLEAGTGQTTVVYVQNNATVDLATSSATVNGSSASDMLIGITSAVVAGINDTLIGGTGSNVLSSIGENNTLIAGSGANTLSSSGFGDTLIGNATGSTLDGTNGAETVANYAIDDVTVDLASGTATVNGSSVSDTLLGITSAMASGTNDTLIGGSGMTTLFSNAGGNTLQAGTGQTVASYTGNGLTVNLAVGTATVNGSGVSDTLIGITSVVVSGSNDTLVGWSNDTLELTGGSGNVLSIAGTGGVLKSDSGSNTLVGYGSNETLIGGSGADMLSASGIGDTLIAGSGANILIGYGDSEVLIGGSGVDTLSAGGSGDTLMAGSGTNILIGYGNNEVLIGGSGADELTASGIGDTLIAGSGANILIGYGNNEVLIGGSGADILSASGSGDTLTAGSGTNILIGYGNNEVLIAGSGTSTLVDSGTGGFFDYNLGAGQARITSGAAANSTASNELDFGAGISDNQLWFIRAGNDLQIDLMGTANEVTIANWFGSTGNQLQEITASGQKLDSQVSQLVQAMATYSANNSGFDPSMVSQIPNDPALQTAITSSWHA